MLIKPLYLLNRYQRNLEEMEVVRSTVVAGLIWALGAAASPALAEPISLSDRNMDSVTPMDGGIDGWVLEAVDKETVWGDPAVVFSRNLNTSLEQMRAGLAAGISLTRQMAGASGEASESVIASTGTSTTHGDTVAPVSSASSVASAVGSVSSDGSTSSIRRISSSQSVGAGGLQATAIAASISISNSISSTNVAVRVAPGS